MTEELKQAAQQALEALIEASGHVNNEQFVNVMMARDALVSALAQRPAAQTEREAFENAARAKWGPLDFKRSEVEPEMYYNQRLDDAWIGFGFAVAWLRASLPAPQQATPDLADGPARMHWTNWMPVKDALEYAYQKMGLEMVKTDAGSKYPNQHWNLAGLVREFVVAQQDAMFGKCQACGKNVGLLDQIKCLDCGTRLCEPCAKEHFGSDHGARAAASHSHPAPTTSGWVETSAPPQRLDWSDTQQATPEPVQFDQAGHFYNLVGHALMDVERPDACAHRLRLILDELAALLRQPATPEPVGERWVVVRETALDVGRGNDVRTGGRPELGYALVSDAATFGSEGEAVAAIESANLPVGWVVLPLSRLLPDLEHTLAAPGVPEDVLAILDECRSALMECDRDGDYALIDRIDALAAAQAKGGE